MKELQIAPAGTEPIWFLPKVTFPLNTSVMDNDEIWGDYHAWDGANTGSGYHL